MIRVAPASARRLGRTFSSSLAALMLALSAVVMVAVVAPAPAVAQDARAQAKEAYQRGKQMFDAGNFTGAIAEFERAKQLAPSPVLDFNIGLAHDRLGNAAEAVNSYRAYLQAVPDAANRSTVEARIAALEPKVAAPMEPLPPASGPAEQAPSDADDAGAPDDGSLGPITAPPVGIAPPVAPPSDAVSPESAPGPDAFVAPSPGVVDERSDGPVAPRIPARTGDPELDRVIGIDLNAIRARFRGPAVGPPQR